MKKRKPPVRTKADFKEKLKEICGPRPQGTMVKRPGDPGFGVQPSTSVKDARAGLNPSEEIDALNIFGGVAFDPNRRADDVDPGSGYNNGQRAQIGWGTLAAYCFLADKPEAKAILVNDIDLTEAPDEALTDLLANLMHYCHREKIEFYGEDGVLVQAMRHFNAESGGAAL